MALGDPFAATLEAGMKQNEQNQQNIQGGLNSFAAQAQQAKQQKMAHDLLQQTGMLKEDVIPPSVDDLKSNLQQFGQKTGRNVNFNISPDASTEEQTKFLVGIHKAYGIPLPQPKINTTLNLTPGTSYTPATGDLSFKGEQKQLTPEESAVRFKMALENAPEGAVPVENQKGGITYKPKTSSTLDDISQRASRYAQSVADDSQSFDPHAYNYRNRDIYAEEFRKAGVDMGDEEKKFYASKAGMAQLEKLGVNVETFENTFRRNADVALKIADTFDKKRIGDLGKNIPLINKLELGSKVNIEGDPQASRLMSSIWTVATEYARLTSAPGATGSQVTDSARTEARNLLNEYMNNGTLHGLLDPVKGEEGNYDVDNSGQMSLDAQNRLDSLKNANTRYVNKGKNVAQVAGVAPRVQTQQVDYKSRYGLK